MQETVDFENLVVREAHDALIVTARDGRVAYWSPGASNVFGYGQAEATGQLLEGLLVPSERVAEDRRIVAETLDAGFASFESLRRRKDGSLLYVHISSKAIRNGNGAVEYLLFSKTDVTRQRALRDARLAEARFGALLNSMPDGIVMVNPSGRIVFANEEAGRLFGYTQGELRGAAVETLMPRRFHGAHVAHRTSYFVQSRPRAMGAGLELRGLRKDGAEFPLEISLGAVQTEEGTLVSASIRDISERRRAELDLHEKNAELERASRTKDRFLATMSHELRTPLNAIIGFTGTLLMRLPGPLLPEQERQLRTVQDSARHLLSLINDLLDLAKIESGKITLSPESTDCRAVVDEVLAALGPAAGAKQLRLASELADQAVPVRTDRRALSQILMNLVSNAIKYTSAGSVTVECARDAAAVRLTVADTGVGIGPEEGARLFDAFTQVGDRARHHEGTGLGLYLCRKLADLLGAQLEFTSTPGAGSRFTLVLPVS